MISVDMKKKRRLIGERKNGGHAYSQKGYLTCARVGDFSDLLKGKEMSYGSDDVSHNTDFVRVGISADTAECAVNSIRRWWREMGESVYKDASELYINADGGGSNGAHVRLWKIELQMFANELTKKIHVSHVSPGIRKWNKREHTLLCFISKKWRRKSFIDHVAIVHLSARTTPTKGSTTKSILDKRGYEKGIKITHAELEQIHIAKDPFYGEWNYTILPESHFLKQT